MVVVQRSGDFGPTGQEGVDLDEGRGEHTGSAVMPPVSLEPGLDITEIAKNDWVLAVRPFIGCWLLKRESGHGKGVHWSHVRRSDTHGR